MILNDIIDDTNMKTFEMSVAVLAKHLNLLIKPDILLVLNAQ